MDQMIKKMNNTKLIKIKDVDLIVIEEVKKITEDYQINKNPVISSINFSNIIMILILLIMDITFSFKITKEYS